MLPRYLISDGYNASLDAIAKFFGLDIYSYNTGKPAYKWIVPERYLCRKVEISDEQGNVIISNRETPQIVIPYSKSFDGLIDYEELKEHIYIEENMISNEAIPFKSKCYTKREWGISCSHDQMDRFGNGKYRVIIDSDFSYDKARVASWTISGNDESTIVFVAHLDGAYQFNWGLSGVIAGLKAFETIKTKQLNHTYILLIVPKDVGLACWLKDNEEVDVRGIITLDMLGLRAAGYCLMRSDKRDSRFDYETCEIIKEYEEDIEVCDFEASKFVDFDKERVYEERKYNYFDISEIKSPMMSLSMKAKKHSGSRPFSEYHTSEDTVERADLCIIERSIGMLVDYINKIDERSL